MFSNKGKSKVFLKVGIIILGTDRITEYVTHKLLPPNINCSFSRIKMEGKETNDNINSLYIHRALECLCPTIVNYDMIVYACTSGSIRIGEKNITDIIHSISPRTKVITFQSAILSALQSLNAKTIQLVTPYIETINNDFIRFFNRHNVKVNSLCGLNIKDDYEISNVSDETIYHAVKQNFKKGSDCIFISCTNFKSIGIINKIEKEFSIPVITSHQILLWRIMNRLKVNIDLITYKPYGSLMRIDECVD